MVEGTSMAIASTFLAKQIAIGDQFWSTLDEWIVFEHTLGIGAITTHPQVAICNITTGITSSSSDVLD